MGSKTHGERCGRRLTPEYRAWQQMRNRCSNRRSKDYPYYGGRGITVCEAWEKSFTAFLEHVGRRPSSEHTLDRKNSDLNYEPDNVRWATRATQSRNRRSFKVHWRNHPLSRPIKLGAITDSIAGWANRLGMSRTTIRGRLALGLKPSLILKICKKHRRHLGHPWPMKFSARTNGGWLNHGR